MNGHKMHWLMMPFYSLSSHHPYFIATMTSTGFLSLQQQELPAQTLPYTTCQSFNDKDDHGGGMQHNDHRKLLVDLVRDHHSLYFMEHRDRPNVVARVLVTLHELGGKL